MGNSWNCGAREKRTDEAKLMSIVADQNTRNDMKSDHGNAVKRMEDELKNKKQSQPNNNSLQNQTKEQDIFGQSVPGETRDRHSKNQSKEQLLFGQSIHGETKDFAPSSVDIQVAVFSGEADATAFSSRVSLNEQERTHCHGCDSTKEPPYAFGVVVECGNPGCSDEKSMLKSNSLTFNKTTIFLDKLTSYSLLRVILPSIFIVIVFIIVVFYHYLFSFIVSFFR
tara:strand:+ start:181 stop:855 length:675 start_codon:yes stop_codon:yes gene_type:complete